MIKLVNWLPEVVYIKEDDAPPIHLAAHVTRITSAKKVWVAGVQVEMLSSVFETAWNELAKCFGERMQQDELDLMDSVLQGVELDIQEEGERG